MTTNYSIDFENNSVNAGDVCIYQTQPDIGVYNVMSLAWLTKKAASNSDVKFTWGIDYSFVWSETGELKPGVIFEASQNIPADLDTDNQIKLTYPDGYYEFSETSVGPNPGNLYISEGARIPINQASVGIGMSGAGTFVVQAQPNMNLMFTPHPVYWITFGNFEPGQVLDIEQVTNKAEIPFPANCYEMKAVLNQDNTWDIIPA